ncbi:chitin disaccharide deacetylase [Virgibacillus salexigens]|uniref:Hopanoid biosynthesis associated protein HpnK n=1 Tax=Virgibacillus massiliensis TaxID=1462526 RepID=A0A024Q7Z8_9BACI|nr:MULTISPECIES: chitin disaccharide deacetylase [Virgibacillus]CDQ38340.1 hopanoid biosynthesis associated protein HpnK [Virgibacillus massiliensis]
MMHVLFNADDFGLTKGVTDGIIMAHQNGVVTSTTLMMNGKAVNYAVARAKENDTLHVGIHLVLTWGKPLSSVPELVCENNRFKYSSRYRHMEAPNLQAVEKEWRAQIEAFLATGLSLHHIDSHHHVHGWEPLQQLIISLAKEYQVPVRITDNLAAEQDILLTEQIWLDFYGDEVSADIFTRLKQTNAKSIEVMTHPAIVDKELRQISSYTDKRKQELDILCSLHVPDWAIIE